MKWLLIGAVLIYRGLARHRIRRRCLFRESCSQHVLRVAREHGLARGLKALTWRIRVCRGGYRVLPTPQGHFAIQLVDGTVIPPDGVSLEL